MNDVKSSGALLAAAVAGDGEALSSLLEDLANELKRFIQGEISPKYRNHIEVDDVLQVTYFETFLRIERFDPQDVESFRRWLFTAAGNNVRDAVRGLSAAKRPPADRQDPYEVLLEQSGARLTSATVHAARAEFRLFVEHALDQLPPDYKAVLQLTFLQGLSAEEAQAHLPGRSLGAIHMLRQRALAALRDHLPSATKFFTFYDTPKPADVTDSHK